MKKRPGDARSPRSSHLDRRGRVAMVDVSGKEPTRRRAVAEAEVRLSRLALMALKSGRLAKGSVEAVVRIAGIQAAKRTAEIVPLCHPLPLESVGVELSARRGRVRIRIETVTHARTGVEMEAMTGAAAAALALYDMIKGVDRAAEIVAVRLLEKSGGRSGAYRRPRP